MSNPDLELEAGTEEVTSEPDANFEEFMTPPEGSNPFEDSLQQSAAEETRPTGDQTEAEETAEVETKAEEPEAEETAEVTAEEKVETKAEETESDGITEEDMDKYLAKKHAGADEVPESLRPYTETQKQEAPPEEQLPGIDLGQAKEALIKAIGEEEGKTVADSLAPYMGSILEQADKYISAAIDRGIKTNAMNSERQGGYLRSAASAFYDAFPQLNTPANKKLVGANYNQIIRSGRKFANDGEMLHQLGQACLDELGEIGKAPAQRKRAAAAESVGSTGARDVNRGGKKTKEKKSTSEEELDGVLDHFETGYDRSGVSILQ